MVLVISFGPNTLDIWNSLELKHILVYQLQPQPYAICTASITEYSQIFDSIFDSQILGAAYDLSTRDVVSGIDRRLHVN